jgi:sugar-specific transcriptional regulator TrmB
MSIIGIMIKEKQLEILGLKEKEARLYLAALTFKSFTVVDIAKKSGIKRPTCYIILDSLTKRGLVSVILKDKKQMYKAESPQTFIRQANNALNYAKKFVPSLISLYEEDKEKSIVKFYYGQNGMRNIYEDIIDSDVKEVRYIGSTEPMIEIVGDEFMKDYIERCIEKGIKRMSIRMKNTEVNEHIYKGTKDLLREIRYSPSDIYIPSTVFIYGDKAAIVSTSKTSFGMVIESQEFNKTMLGLFQALWNISSEK